MSDRWRRLEDHLKDASLYEEASPRTLAPSWRRRVLARHGSVADPLPTSNRTRRILPAALAFSLVVTCLSLAWYYGFLDGLLSRLDLSSLELGHRRPSEWLQVAARLLDLELPQFGYKSYLALLSFSFGLTFLIRRRSLNILPLDW